MHGSWYNIGMSSSSFSSPSVLSPVKVAVSPIIASFFGLSDSDVTAAREAVAKLAARALKAGIPGADTLGIEVVNTTTKVVTDPDFGDIGEMTTYDISVLGSIGLGGKVVGVTTFNIEGLELPEGLIAPINGADVSSFPVPTRTCAHCGYSRDRSKTVFCEVDGVVAEYGTSCLRLIAGIDGTDAVAGVLSALARIASDDDEEFFGSRHAGAYHIPIRAFVKLTLASLKIEGYVSSSRAWDFGGTATGAWVFSVANNFLSKRDEPAAKALRAAAALVDDATVDAAVAYCTSGGVLA